MFDALGAKTYVINNEPNGLNINVDSGSTHIEVLQQFVLDNGLDVGFAFDGDADRCLAVDKSGMVIDGDKILYIYGCYMKERGKLVNNTVVTTVMSNFGLYKAFDEKGIDYVKTDVGDKYVSESMRANGHRLGGEQSGHIIFGKYATTGDGVLTAIKLMQVMIEKKASLRELCAPMKVYPQLLQSICVTDRDAVMHDPEFAAGIARAEQALGGNGRILVRQSGTEPVIRILVEAGTDADCAEHMERLVELIKNRGYIKNEV